MEKDDMHACRPLLTELVIGLWFDGHKAGQKPDVYS